MHGGCDKGFCFLYWRLSYRRKFIRTLWTMGIIVAIIIGAVIAQPAGDHFGLYLFALTVLVLGPIQAAYNYWRWQSELQSNGPRQGS